MGKILERQRVAAYCRVSTDSEDQFYIHEHYEPMISEEVFEKAS